ncbi:MAG: hypothetical protein ABIW76_16055 [Fibrobacteria bacterium]
MLNRRIILIRICLAAAVSLPLWNCGTAPVAEAGPDAATLVQATATTTVILGKVGALAKANTINLSRLIVTGTSNAVPADSFKDTTAVSGNTQVTITKNYTLKPLRSWTLAAKTLDAKDSIIHTGTTASFYVKPADTAAISLNLASRFAMYQANFNSLPDSISSSTPGTGKDAVKIKRVVMKLDGAIKADSSVSGQFSGGQSVSVFFDYVGIGSHGVVLEAYGDLNTYSGLLFSGTSTFTVSAGTDDTKSITLGWAGPTTGTGKLSVVIGKVGKVTINGALPGTLLLKGGAQ